jgi:hypothetical protein
VIKTHCLKDGWFFVNKFHHFDELLHHMIPDHLKDYGLHHLIKPSNYIMYFLMLFFLIVIVGVLYLVAWIYYKKTRGLNINEMYIADVLDMITGGERVNRAPGSSAYYNEL